MIKLRKYLPLLIITSLLGCASSPERKKAAQECHRTGYSSLSAHMGCMKRWENSQKLPNTQDNKKNQDKLSNAAISSVICSAIAKDSASCIAGSLEGSNDVSQNLEKQRIEKMEREIKRLKEEKDDLERKKFRENLDKPRRY